MQEPSVAVYIDFDNVVISRQDQAKRSGVDPVLALDVLFEYATRFGRVTISRAYADWSLRKNAEYREQLVRRAVDLTQLFPASRTKNGADIRMAIDAIDDLYQREDVGCIVIVAGDSDYIPLAQRARRLGRTVVGIGVAGSISRTLATACDEYRDYDDLLAEFAEDERAIASAEAGDGAAGESAAGADAVGAGDAGDGGNGVDGAQAGRRPAGRAAQPTSAPNPGRLLLRALRTLTEQHPDREWHSLGAVKNQMLRVAPDFQEREHGFSSFSDFVRKYNGQIEVADNRARLR